MASKLTPARLAAVERNSPREWPPLTVDYTFVKSVDGRRGRDYVGFRIETLPRDHLFAEKQLQFAIFSELVTRRILGHKVGGPWTVVEVFDPPVGAAMLRHFDIDAAFRWRFTFPDEFSQFWSKEPEDRWIRVLMTLAGAR